MIPKLKHPVNITIERSTRERLKALKAEYPTCGSYDRILKASLDILDMLIAHIKKEGKK